jgi:hypothetical protein
MARDVDLLLIFLTDGYFGTNGGKEELTVTLFFKKLTNLLAGC